MALGTFKLFNVFGKSVFTTLRENGLADTTFYARLNAPGRKVLITHEWWQWGTLNNYRGEDGGRWHKYMSNVRLEYDDGVCTLKCAPFQYAKGVYLGNSCIAENGPTSMVFGSRIGANSSNHVMIGFIDLTTDDQVTPWDIWSAPINVSFAGDIVFQVRIQRNG